MTVALEPETEKQDEEHEEESCHGGDGFDGNSYDDDGGDDDGRPDPDPPPESAAQLPPDVFGMLVFIASEFVLFAVMIFAFVRARTGQLTWPPPGQPRLPLLLTDVNTFILLASGFTMYRAWRHILAGNQRALRVWLLITTGLGAVFLMVQGVEWVRLIGFGLTVTANIYGATFYVIIGAHALHVFIAILILMIVWRRASRNVYTRTSHTGVILCSLFWGFVVLVWPILYVVVYLI